MREPSLPNVVTPTTHQNAPRYMYVGSTTMHRSCETDLQSPHKNFAWWTVTQRTSQNHRTVKVGGWAFAQKWALVGVIWYIDFRWKFQEATHIWLQQLLEITSCIE